MHTIFILLRLLNIKRRSKYDFWFHMFNTKNYNKRTHIPVRPPKGPQTVAVNIARTLRDFASARKCDFVRVWSIPVSILVQAIQLVMVYKRYHILLWLMTWTNTLLQCLSNCKKREKIPNYCKKKRKNSQLHDMQNPVAVDICTPGSSDDSSKCLICEGIVSNCTIVTRQKQVTRLATHRVYLGRHWVPILNIGDSSVTRVNVINVTVPEVTAYACAARPGCQLSYYQER